MTWGMIGCGDVTERKNGPGLYKADHSRLKGVYSRTRARARDYAQRHGVEMVYPVLEELLADEEIHAVYIATPPRSHKELALACIRAGKVPYIEKPMALCYDDCVEILDAARKEHLPVYVAFYRRGGEKYRKIRELLEQGAIGTVRCVEVRQLQPPEPGDLDREHLPWRLLPEAGGGKFLDMGVHVLDYLSLFFGDMVEMRGVAENLGGLYPVEDTVSASFRFESGVVGNGLWCYVADRNEEKTVITGSEGRMEFHCMDMGGSLKVIRGEEVQILEFEQPEHVGQAFVQTIVDELTGRGRCPGSAACAANNIKMIDGLLEEYRRRYSDRT